MERDQVGVCPTWREVYPTSGGMLSYKLRFASSVFLRLGSRSHRYQTGAKALRRDLPGRPALHSRRPSVSRVLCAKLKKPVLRPLELAHRCPLGSRERFDRRGLGFRKQLADKRRHSTLERRKSPASPLRWPRPSPITTPRKGRTTAARRRRLASRSRSPTRSTRSSVAV